MPAPSPASRSDKAGLRAACRRAGGPADGSRNGANPNGSARDIAGILSDTRTVLGMMPHPERLSDPALGGNDGRVLFDHLVAALG